MSRAAHLPSTGLVKHGVHLIRLRWLSGVAVFVLVVGLAAALLFLTRPIYRVEARLRLGEPPPMTGVSPGAGIFGLFRSGGDPFANDLELLGSRTVAEDMVDDADLQVSVVAPRGWHRDSLFTSLAAGRETRTATYEATWDSAGGVLIRMLAPRDSVIGTAGIGAPVSFGDVTAVFAAHGPGGPRTIQIVTTPFARAARLSRPRVVAERARREANIVDLSFDDPDPGVALAAVRSALSRFVGIRTMIQRRESGQTVDSLREVAVKTRAELAGAEARLEETQRRSHLVAPDEQKEAFITRYSEVSTRLKTVAIEQASLERLAREAASATDSSAIWRDLVAFPPFLTNAAIGGVLGQLTTRQVQRAELATRRREENRDLRALDDQIATLDSTLRALITGYRRALDEEAAALGIELRSMDSALTALPRATVELARRERDVRLLSEIMVLTEQRLRQEELREALTFANVQIIDPPALRDKPIWPRRGTGLVIAVLLGGVFGILAMAVHQRADQTVRSAREIQHILDAPVLLALERGANGGAGALGDEILAALQRAAPIAERPVPQLALAAARGDGAAREVAGALVAAGAFTIHDTAQLNNGKPALLVTSPIQRFATAAAAASTGAPVLVVVEAARTTREELERTADLLSQTGARVAGAIVLCAKARDVRDVWR